MGSIFRSVLPATHLASNWQHGGDSPSRYASWAESDQSAARKTARNNGPVRGTGTCGMMGTPWRGCCLAHASGRREDRHLYLSICIIP
jgi:hypothetical protein